MARVRKPVHNSKYISINTIDRNFSYSNKMINVTLTQVTLPKEADSVLEHFPSNLHRLVPLTSGERKLLSGISVLTYDASYHHYFVFVE